MQRPTATRNSIALRYADFATLTDALDYAAQGDTGANFYNGRGELTTSLPYASLRADAHAVARRLHGMGLERGERIALVAETTADFVRFFFGAQYAGLVPVPLPASVHLGGREAFVRQQRALLDNCDASVAVAPDAFVDLLRESARGLELRFCGTPEEFAALPLAAQMPRAPHPDELAYLQYTSGSTRFPRGVMIDHATVMDNLAGIVRHGLEIGEDDRFMSWLPYYHDMGLVGLIFAPLTSQRSVDYLGTRDYAMRPRLWLDLMERNRATIAFSPPFGYELCARRLRPADRERYDLSAWRIAGVGAETIRATTLDKFAEATEAMGFRREAFLPCYGMAECSLAISFAPLDQPPAVDVVDAQRLAGQRAAVPVPADGEVQAKGFVNCGRPLPGFEMEIRADDGRVLGDRECGSIFVRSRSVMSGYFNEPEITRETLSADGWLNTGDVGYCLDGDIYVTGRAKDLFIINGRNIWPQDMEALAEEQPEVRPEDSSAFVVPGPHGEDIAVMVVQCRENDQQQRDDLVQRLQSAVRAELGIECFVELVAPHTLPRTSSGKLSRSRARREFLERSDWSETPQLAEAAG